MRGFVFNFVGTVVPIGSVIIAAVSSMDPLIKTATLLVGLLVGMSALPGAIIRCVRSIRIIRDWFRNR